MLRTVEYVLPFRVTVYLDITYNIFILVFCLLAGTIAISTNNQTFRHIILLYKYRFSTVMGEVYSGKLGTCGGISIRSNGFSRFDKQINWFSASQRFYEYMRSVYTIIHILCTYVIQNRTNRRTDR